MHRPVIFSLFASLFFALPPLMAQSGPVQVWAAPSLQKVRPSDPVQTSNLVWSQESRTINLAGARNEHVPFQVIITTPPPPDRHGKAAEGFFAEVSDLVSQQGRINRDQIRIYFEHMILCYGRSGPVGATGFWPDALAPLTDPFSMNAEFREFVKNRVLWIDVFVPVEAGAGLYKGTLTVTQQGKTIDRLNLGLKVYGFALPEETHLITYMGISQQRLGSFYGLKEASPELKSLREKYYEFLYSNRMEPWFNDPLQPEVEVGKSGEITVKFDDSLYSYYMTRLRTKRVILEAAPSSLVKGPGMTPFSEEFVRRMTSYVGQVFDYYKKHNWIPKLVFNSPIDEPSTAQQYADTRRYAELVHATAPGVPFLATEAPVPEREEWGSLTGLVNNFSIHGNDLNRLEVKKAIRTEQAKGGEITWYISCDQVYPQPNYFIDAPAMDPVMVPWITWRYGMNGILYWDLAYWPQTPDPWLDPVTYLSGFLCSEGGVLNGEGSLIYPGNHTRRYTGQKNVDGPVSSLRFELLREGIEDYEYLWLLKSLGDGAFADRAVESMVVDVSAFSRNPGELMALRQKMAERIEELKGK
jgi:hypothetical protein